MAPIFCNRTSERASERTNERTNERAGERTNERTQTNNPASFDSPPIELTLSIIFQNYHNLSGIHLAASKEVKENELTKSLVSLSKGLWNYDSLSLMYSVVGQACFGDPSREKQLAIARNLFERVGNGFELGEGRENFLSAKLYFGVYEESLLKGIKYALKATNNNGGAPVNDKDKESKAASIVEREEEESESESGCDSEWLIRAADALFELRKFKEAEEYYRAGLERAGGKFKDDEEWTRIITSLQFCEQN